MTEKLRTQLVIVVVILQMLFFAGWYLIEAQAFSKPIAKIMVKTMAYDPRDLLSGQYIRLQYSFTNTPGRWDNELKKRVEPEWISDIKNKYGRIKRHTDLWVVLHEVNGFYEPKSASFEQPINLTNGEVVIKGHTKRYTSIEYGIEKYFVPEGTKEPNRDDTTVELDVYKGGKVRISKVFVKGKVWP